VAGGHTLDGQRRAGDWKGRPTTREAQSCPTLRPLWADRGGQPPFALRLFEMGWLWGFLVCQITPGLALPGGLGPEALARDISHWHARVAGGQRTVPQAEEPCLWVKPTPKARGAGEGNVKIPHQTKGEPLEGPLTFVAQKRASGGWLTQPGQWEKARARHTHPLRGPVGGAAL